MPPVRTDFSAAGKFELQRSALRVRGRKWFQQYAAMLTRSDEHTDLLTVVRPLVRMVKELPEYVERRRQIAEITQRVLRAMKEARQPSSALQ